MRHAFCLKVQNNDFPVFHLLSNDVFRMVVRFRDHLRFSSKLLKINSDVGNIGTTGTDYVRLKKLDYQNAKMIRLKCY